MAEANEETHKKIEPPEPGAEKLSVSEKIEKKPLHIPDAILIGIIPFLAYGLLYSFESNYLGYFAIPSQFMSFEIAELMLIVLIVIVLFFIVILLLAGLQKITSIVKSPFLKRKLFISGLFMIYVVALFFLMVPANRTLILILIALSIAVIIYIILPTFNKNKSSINDEIKMSEGLGKKNYHKEESFVGDIFNFFRSDISNIFFAYILLFSFIGFIGTNIAYNQKSFYVVKAIPECVVIYTKSDKLICISEVDLQSKEFSKGYQVIFLQDLKGVKVVYENIGPLRGKPTLTPTPTNTPVPITSTVSTPLITITP